MYKILKTNVMYPGFLGALKEQIKKKNNKIDEFVNSGQGGPFKDTMKTVLL